MSKDHGDNGGAVMHSKTLFAMEMDESHLKDRAV